MPLQNDEIFKALGLEGKTFESIEEFVSEHGTLFRPSKAPVTDEDANRILGSAFRKSTVEFKRQLKSLGIEPTFDDKEPFESIVKTGFTQIGDFLKEKEEEFSASSGKGNDEVVKLKDTEILKWKSKAQEEKEGRELAINSLQQKEVEFGSTLKNFKLQTKIADTRDKHMKWANGVTEVHKRGFDTIFNEKYSTDLDEQDNVIVTDKQGQQIPNKSKAGAFLSLPEVLETEAKAQKVWQVNPHANNNQPPVNRIQNTTEPISEGGIRRAKPIIIGTGSH